MWDGVVKNLRFLPFFKQLFRAETQLQCMRKSNLLLNTELQRMRNSYLSTMEACLTGTIYQDPPLPLFQRPGYDHALRESGMDWPSTAHTMIGVKRLANLRSLTEQLIKTGVPGDFIETGVWRGGACIMVRAVLKAYDVHDRRVWVADSFEGLPPPNPDQYPQDKGSDYHTYSELAVSVEELRNNFRKYGLLDDQVVFLKGWFDDTLPSAPVERLALIRLDGDMYQSIIVPLRTLYNKLSDGGYVIVDDYHLIEQTRTAVHDFVAEQGISPQFFEVDGNCVYWQKRSA